MDDDVRGSAAMSHYHGFFANDAVKRSFMRKACQISPGLTGVHVEHETCVIFEYCGDALEHPFPFLNLFKGERYAVRY